MTHIGNNIKKIRKLKRLSQQAFADFFDLTRGNISSYEESRAEPKIEVIIRIANFFSIPVTDLIEKELSVNELVHYNTRFVVETEQLKTTRPLTNIPYISAHYISDYIQFHDDPRFIRQLPVITIPAYSKFELIAIELQDPNALPAGFDYRTGDILIFEQIAKENAHHIPNKLGMMITADSLQFGIYKSEDKTIALTLNDWVKFPFDIEAPAKYKLLFASYRQE